MSQEQQEMRHQQLEEAFKLVWFHAKRSVLYSGFEPMTEAHIVRNALATVASEAGCSQLLDDLEHNKVKVFEEQA